MPLSEILPTVDRLSHQDKLRLIHFLLLAVAKEEGCNLEPVDETEILLTQMASTEALVWSPQIDQAAVQALSELLVQETNSQWSDIILSHQGFPDFPAFESYRDELSDYSSPRHQKRPCPN
jgi:hypothetical protein